jgi:hypothetical protein
VQHFVTTLVFASRATSLRIACRPPESSSCGSRASAIGWRRFRGQARRHDVRPGITGWAAVDGRNATSWQRRLALDVWYVDRWSLGLDLKILLLTVIKVLRRDGISAAGHATMPRFDEAACGAGGAEAKRADRRSREHRR